LFSRFKTGEDALAFPLALAMHRALAKAHRLDFDVIIPVPLSPDKAEKKELHRTLLLAKELARLTDAPAREWLSLTRPVSKRRLRLGQGYGAAAFEGAYAKVLQVDPKAASTVAVLLVDDVCTEGSTLRVCSEAIHALNPDATVVAATAGQMTVRQAVADPTTLWD
jgi:predicted amidophosphoribosyltransferase